MVSFKTYITEMSNLAGKELYKYDWRAELFIKKLKNNEPFELTNGKKVIFIQSKDVLDIVKKRQPTTGIKLYDKKGNSYMFKDIAKNIEFGGRGSGSGTAIEDKELLSLIKQIDDAKAKEKSSTIKIKVGSKIYDVYTAQTTPGTPKSDFELLDINGKTIVWISHKAGSKPNDFQQWGGLSSAKEPLIFSHKETQKFINDLKTKFPDGLPPATTMYRKIKDTKLKMLSVYGNKFGGSLGEQNVSVLLQGPVKIIKRGQYYFLDSNHVHYNGESVDSDGFEPVLMAIYKGDRSDAGIKGTRLGISPIKSRKGTEFK
jgi:hypothetical protein